MAKKSDKKTTIILLILLAISIIGGGIWTYKSLKPLEVEEVITKEENSLVGLSLDTVYKIKQDAIDNIKDFLPTRVRENTIWNSFYTDVQFNKLKDRELNINIDGYLNNPNPFVVPSSTEEGEEL